MRVRQLGLSSLSSEPTSGSNDGGRMTRSKFLFLESLVLVAAFATSGCGSSRQLQSCRHCSRRGGCQELCQRPSSADSHRYLQQAAVARPTHQPGRGLVRWHLRRFVRWLCRAFRNCRPERRGPVWPHVCRNSDGARGDAIFGNAKSRRRFTPKGLRFRTGDLPVNFRVEILRCRVSSGVSQ